MVAVAVLWFEIGVWIVGIVVGEVRACLLVVPGLGIGGYEACVRLLVV